MGDPNLDDIDWENFDTSQVPFPNTLWHVKPAKEIALKTTAMLVVGLAGIFLNSVILIVLIKNRWLWSASNYLIGNLALTDLLTLIICPWFMLVRDFFQAFVLKNFGCRFEGFLQASFLISSVCAILLVSYDRLAAAALTAEARVTLKAAPMIIIATWICSCALSLPWILKREYIERPWKDYLESFCVEDTVVLGIYWHFLLMLIVWIPLGVMMITYGTIMWRLECSVRELSSRGGGQSIARARSRALRITACVLLTGICCRIPYTILVYRRNRMPLQINGIDGSFEIMWFAANYLMYMNCAVNPLIYGFTNARFRKAMDRTPGIACFKFGTWCCMCTMFNKKGIQIVDKHTEKIFVIGNSPKPNKRFSKTIKNILHINKDSMDFSLKVDEATTKPTKITPVKNEQV